MPLLNKKTPYIIATGFTTAFLGDERTLREFIVGDYVREKMARKGENVVLYLVNDSYDPLNYRQLRIGVNKDERLLKEFEGYCGKPIAEIPDPFECHRNYSQHFTHAILKRLHSLEIYPVILDSYQAYQKGYYTDFINITFESYHKIQEMLSKNFNHYTMKKLFYVQCPRCLCIDATHIKKVDGRVIQFECERCEFESNQDITEIRGKLGWKLDCAARWNLYNIDMETFSKAHVAELGSFEISRFISKHFYNGKVPTIIKYGDVKISRELSYKLLEILPPQVIKRLFTAHLTRDLDLTREYVENFCFKFPVRPGLSYTDYILQELPKDAISAENQQDQYNRSSILSEHADGNHLNKKTLISYGNRFSKFYYNRDYGIKLPDPRTIASADRTTAGAALSIISFVLSIRKDPVPKKENEKEDDTLIKSYLFSQKVSSRVYQFLRKVFGQAEGPSIVTLLTILPTDYLNTIQMILAYSTEVPHIRDNFCPEPSETINNVLKERESKEIGKNIDRISELTNNLLEVIHETDKNISSNTTASRSISGMPEGD